MTREFDVAIIGAGAAGLMCAAVAGRRGRRVLVLESQHTVGRKIRISGGGRCNFTNIYCSSESFISQNPHFAKSALARFTPEHFIALVRKHHIAFHEKKLGQLFCDNSAQQIIDMLMREALDAQVAVVTECRIQSIQKSNRFTLQTSLGEFTAESVVVACGGLSLPSIGASDFGYRVAEQFGIGMVSPQPGLVGLRLSEEDQKLFHELRGVSADAIVGTNAIEFRENILFTHRGVSGPAILQISSYCNAGESIHVDMFPRIDLSAAFQLRKPDRTHLHTILSGYVPHRLATVLCDKLGGSRAIHTYTSSELTGIEQQLHNIVLRPIGNEGYDRAEVTRGGVDTDCLSSKTMQCNSVEGLYFIGEVVDVTGHLGGHNFQWAWASGAAAGEYA